MVRSSHVQAFFTSAPDPHSVLLALLQILLLHSQPPPSGSNISSFDPADHRPPHVTFSVLPALPPALNPPLLTSASSAPPDPNPDPNPSFSPPQTWCWTRPPSSKDTSSQPAPLLPLLLAGAEGIVLVHVPVPMSSLPQIEKRLGSFSSDPFTYIKEFECLNQSHNLR